MGFLTSFAQDATSLTVYEVDTTTVSTGAMTGYIVFWLVLIAVAIVAYWKIFSKAGEAGWQSIIPIWSTIVLLKIVGRPAWWILLLFIPFVNFVVMILVMLDLGKSFGRSAVFSVFGLMIFSFIGYLILGFGSDEYIGPAGEAPVAAVA